MRKKYSALLWFISSSKSSFQITTQSIFHHYHENWKSRRLCNHIRSHTHQTLKSTIFTPRIHIVFRYLIFCKASKFVYVFLSWKIETLLTLHAFTQCDHHIFCVILKMKNERVQKNVRVIFGFWILNLSMYLEFWNIFLNKSCRCKMICPQNDAVYEYFLTSVYKW